eukprot:scaffold86023_cov26-Tisochrysis_lutea.AAC.2
MQRGSEGTPPAAAGWRSWQSSHPCWHSGATSSPWSSDPRPRPTATLQPRPPLHPDGILPPPFSCPLL